MLNVSFKIAHKLAGWICAHCHLRRIETEINNRLADGHAIKVLLVGLSVKQFDFLREAGRALLIVGGACAGANLGMMLVASLRRR